MDEKINHGGRINACVAFDPANPEEEPIFQKGMTLRQHYAGEALKICPADTMEIKEIAEWCHKMADAMIEESFKTYKRIEK